MIFEIPQEDILKMLLRQINTFFLYLKRKNMNRRIIIGANVMVGANTIIKDEVCSIKCYSIWGISQFNN